jgi:hypothetical protein
MGRLLARNTYSNVFLNNKKYVDRQFTIPYYYVVMIMYCGMAKVNFQPEALIWKHTHYPPTYACTGTATYSFHQLSGNGNVASMASGQHFHYIKERGTSVSMLSAWVLAAFRIFSFQLRTYPRVFS